MQTREYPAAAPGRPRISVITLFHQGRALARDYLAEWDRQRRAGLADVEWLFGDSASVDGTRELLLATARPWAHVETHAENIGFARGNNSLAARAHGEILLFLNYDIGFSPGWFDELRRAFDGRPDLGVVGNVQLSVRSRLPDHAGVFFGVDGSPYHFRPTPAQLARLDLLPVPAVTGACLAIRRDLFTDIGGFHEGYRTSYEDIELCLQARRRGARVAVATRSVIWHYIGASPGRQSNEAANARLFSERCGAEARELARFAPPDLPLDAPDSTPIAAAASDSVTVQVYYDNGTGFAEADSSVHLVRRGRWNRVEISLGGRPFGRTSRIRLDPGNAPGGFAFSGIAARAGPGRRLVTFVRSRQLLAEAVVSGSARCDEAARGLAIASTGNDPQVVFDLARLFPGLPDDAALEIWLRPEPESVVPSTSTPTRAARRWRDAWSRRRILVDLTRLSPGGVNGGVKVFLLEILEEVARRRRFRLAVHVLAGAEVCREIATAAPSLVTHSSASPDSPEAAALARHAHVLYVPLGFSPLSRADLPQVSLLVDFLHRDIEGALPADEVAAREKWMAETLARSHVLQCNSRFVVNRLHHHYGHPSADLLVVYNAVGQAGRPIRAPRTGTPYFLYPANDWPHKNHDRLVEAYARYRVRCDNAWDLRLTGHFAQPDRVRRVIDRCGVAPNVDVLGHLTDSAFARVFAEAGALVFPSRYEGFGIPVLEAFRLGVPVICSHAASLPEVGGDACGYFDPEDTDSMADTMARISRDHAWRAALIAAGSARARGFDLSLEADKLADAFLGLANRRETKSSA